MKTHDVYAYGVVSSSTLYRIEGAFPAQEGYAEIKGVQHMTGGEAANSSIVLSRLGASVKLDGNWLGADDNGRRTKALLSEFGIDTSRLPLRHGYEGAREVVFAAQDTRTIFGTYGRLLDKRDWNAPEDVDILQSQVVCLDPFFTRPAMRVAQTAATASIPVVLVDCGYDNALLECSAAVVIAESYLRENYPDREPEELFMQYQAVGDGLVIFTFGSQAIWYARPGEDRKLVQPFNVEAVDTTGGGDAFRAGIAYGFLKRWDARKMVAFAAAVAALVCTRSPGVLDAPTCEEVFAFMGARNR